MNLVITHDLRGFRLHDSVDYTGDTYVLDDRRTVSKDRCWPATTFNLEVAAMLYGTRQHTKTGTLKQLRHPEQSAELAVEGVEAYALLNKMQCVLDEELRIRVSMRPPFVLLTEEDIAPLIAIHLMKCEEAKKDPASVPLYFGYAEPEPGKGVFFTDKDGQPTTGGKQAGGGIYLFNKTQVIIGFRDWYLIPKSSIGGVLVQFLKCEPTGATSIKELCGKDFVLVEDGVLVRSGLRLLKAADSDISIDQFLS